MYSKLLISHLHSISFKCHFIIIKFQHSNFHCHLFFDPRVILKYISHFQLKRRIYFWDRVSILNPGWPHCSWHFFYGTRDWIYSLTHASKQCDLSSDPMVLRHGLTTTLAPAGLKLMILLPPYIKYLEHRYVPLHPALPIHTC
jgi:hypothetical protein